MTNQIWDNKNNQVFYDEIPLHKFETFSKKIGLSNHCDLAFLNDQLRSGDDVLEVGAGYGRVLDFLTSCSIKLNVTAIELNPRLFQHLQKRFQGKVQQLILGDALVFDFKKSVDVILLMWSGICEFSKTEQKKLVNRLTQQLKQGGYLYVDTIEPSLQPIGGLRTDGQHSAIALAKQKTIIKGFFPNEQDIKDYLADTPFNLQKIIHYETSEKRPRIIYVVGSMKMD